MGTTTTDFPTTAERARHPDWTATRPRPKAGDFPPGLLEANQRIWDADEAKRQEREALARPIREKRAAEATAKREAEEARQRAREKERADAVEADLKRRYLSVPGATETGWEAEKAQILADHRRRRVTEAADIDDRARALNARRYAHSI